MYTKQVLKQVHTSEPAVNNFGARTGKKKKWLMAVMTSVIWYETLKGSWKKEIYV